MSATLMIRNSGLSRCQTICASTEALGSGSAAPSRRRWALIAWVAAANHFSRGVGSDTGEMACRSAVHTRSRSGAPGEHFALGVWSTLSRKNFEIYTNHFDSGAREDFGPWFGWFSNRLKGYPETLNLKCRLHPQARRQRPWIELEPIEHPLVQDQCGGITYDPLLEIYANNGHVMNNSGSST
jgi:hypothetical protein